MKTTVCLSLLSVFISLVSVSQNIYPDPEFSNEVYHYRKDSSDKLLRLEKNSSKVDTKVKLGGYGGAEMGYTFEGQKSAVILHSENKLSFIFSNGSAEKRSSSNMDSLMRANGMDPSSYPSMGGMDNDPSNSITLYKVSVEKGQRKIFLQKSGGMFGSKKPKSSDKYTFSIKKIKGGYWELIIDKPLPVGEYAFTVASMGGLGNVGGSVVIFAFALR